MALNFSVPKPIFVFLDKDTGKFKILDQNGQPTFLTGGVSGYLVGMRIRTQKYAKASIKDAIKCDFVLQDGDETYILPFGIKTLTVKWACYMVLHDLVNLNKPIGFAVSKSQKAEVILPHWYQDKMAINIPKETWESFPRMTTDEGVQVVDWADVLGNPDMTVVINHTDGYIKQKLESVGITPNQHETDVESHFDESELVF